MIRSKKWINKFWKFLITLSFLSLTINYLFFGLISFLTLFSIIIPNWVYTFYIFKTETNILKKELELTIKEKYSTEFEDFIRNHKDNTNVNILPYTLVFSEKSFLKYPEIFELRNNYNGVSSLFVYVSAISIMVFLLSSVFIMMNMISNNLNL